MATRSTAVSRTGELARLALPFLGPPLLAFVGMSLLLTRLDLSALQGPASGQIILRLGILEAGTPPSPLDAMLVAWTELSPLVLLADLRLLGVLSATAAVLGACLAGYALAGGGSPGRHAAGSCGLAVATCLPVVETSTWIAYDPLAIGISMLSLGLAMACSIGPARLLPLVVPAILGLLLAGVVREIALPMRILLLVLPLLAWRRPLRAVLLAGLVAWSLSAGPQLVAEWMHTLHTAPQQRIQLRLEPQAIRAGLERTYELLHHPDLGRHSLFLLLAAPATLVGVFPGRQWLARLAFLCLATAGTGLVAEAFPEGWLRLRYLEIATLPVVLLCGVGAGWVGWLARKTGPLAWAPALLLAGTLARDSLDGLWTEAREGTKGTGVAMPRLPELPPWRYTLNGMAVGAEPHALAVDGAVELWSLLEQPARPWASLPLSDERGSQVAAVATLGGAWGLVVSKEQCCRQGQAAAECAQQLLDTLDGAGVDLVLPEHIEADWRFANQDPLASALQRLARESGRLETGSRAWSILPARSEGGELPCGRRPLKPRDPRRTPMRVAAGVWWAGPD